jgi:hypothetical protein
MIKRLYSEPKNSIITAWRRQWSKNTPEEIDRIEKCCKTMQRKLLHLADWFDGQIGNNLWRRGSEADEDKEFEVAIKAVDVRIEYLENQQQKMLDWIEANAPELIDDDTPANIVLELLDFYVHGPKENKD